MLNWQYTRRHNHSVRVLTVPRDYQCLCVFVSSNHEIPCIDVHWIPEEKRSVPCTYGPDCPHHWRGCVYKAYPAVLYCELKAGPMQTDDWVKRQLGRFDFSRWSRRALELTSSAHDLLDLAAPGVMFRVGRKRPQKNSPMDWHIYGQIAQITEEQTFDSRPVVEWMWGMHAHQPSLGFDQTKE